MLKNKEKYSLNRISETISRTRIKNYFVENSVIFNFYLKYFVRKSDQIRDIYEKKYRDVKYRFILERNDQKYIFQKILFTENINPYFHKNEICNFISFLFDNDFYLNKMSIF